MYRNLAVIGLGLAIGSVAATAGVAAPQAPADQAADTQAAAPTIPVEDQPSQEQLNKLFEVMRLRQQMGAMLKQLPAMLQQQVGSQIKEMEESATGGATLTAEQKEALKKLSEKYMAKAIQLYPVDEMLTDMSSIYKRHLSREDVDALIAFYSSPAGQHLMELTPTFMKEYMPMAMGRMQERVKALTQEMSQDLKAIVPTAVIPPPK